MKISRPLLVALFCSLSGAAQAQTPRLDEPVDLIEKQVKPEHFHNTSYQNLLLKNGKQEYLIDSQYYSKVLGFYKLGTESNGLIQSWSFMPYRGADIDPMAIMDSLTLIHGAPPEEFMTNLYIWNLSDRHCMFGFNKEESGNRIHYSESKGVLTWK